MCGPARYRHVPVQALDLGQQAVGEGRFLVSVSGEAVVGGELATPHAADPPETRDQRGVPVKADLRGVRLRVIGADYSTSWSARSTPFTPGSQVPRGTKVQVTLSQSCTAAGWPPAH